MGGEGSKNRNQTNPNFSKGKIPGNFLNQDCTTRNFALITYLYFIIIVLSLTMSMAKTLKTIQIFNLPNTTTPLTFSVKTYYHSYVKCFYCILLSFAIKSIHINNPYRHKCGKPIFWDVHSKNVRYNIFFKIFVNSCINMLHIREHGRLNKVVQSLILWLCIINFLLIAIVNPSLLNIKPRASFYQKP